jgi:hypothetical protein
MKLNNKGQSLVMFILIIPILMLILAMVVDIGNLVDTKMSLNNINKLVISCGLDNMDSNDLEEKLVELIKVNNSDIENIELDIQDNKIYIILSYYYESFFGKIVGSKGYEVISKYEGYIEDNQKVIKKVR